MASMGGRLECCCCGNGAGNFKQHWNRDTGYGICADCIAWLRARGTTEEEIKDLYGVEGENFANRLQVSLPEHN